jgi:hypothetical protein
MKKSSILLWSITLVGYGAMFFWVGKMSTPKPANVDPYEAVIAKARARGVEWDRSVTATPVVVNPLRQVCAA